jgi:hypothetical protein
MMPFTEKSSVVQHNYTQFSLGELDDTAVVKNSTENFGVQIVVKLVSHFRTKGKSGCLI